MVNCSSWLHDAKQIAKIIDFFLNLFTGVCYMSLLSCCDKILSLGHHFCIV